MLPGVYREGTAADPSALTVTQDGIALVGLSSPGHPVVLENAGGQLYGLWVSPADSAEPPVAGPRPPCGSSGVTLRGFWLSGFTLQGFRRHGAHLACVEGFALLGNVSDGNAVYGLFPVLSRHGVLANNEVMNTDLNAALYVGQSDDVLISGNRVHNNLIGIEIENSRRCTVLGNDVYANTVGLLVHVLPNLLRTTQEDTTVAENKVHDNNRGIPEDSVAAFPPGIGILLVGADTTIVSGNHVTRNGSLGLGVVNPCLSRSCDGFNVDPNPDGNRIVGNVFQDNGTAPPLSNPMAGLLPADLVWDRTGEDNCWQFNVFTTSVPPVLPACH